MHSYLYEKSHCGNKNLHCKISNISIHLSSEEFSLYCVFKYICFIEICEYQLES